MSWGVDRLRVPARRMTLVELLVAVALGMILIGVITFVWIQSNRIFTTTIHRLETYQRLRTVMDTMERDLANTARTIDMEFFVDHVPPGQTVGNGFYDAEDSELQVGTEHFRTPRDPSDPLKVADEDEFAIAKGVEALGIKPFPPTDATYLYAPTVISPPPYKIGGGYTDGRFYWRDEVYVRSFAMADGINRPALIHYRLVQLENGRSVLRRRIWFLDGEGEVVPPDPAAGVAGTDRVSLLTDGIADLKVAFYFKENTAEGDGHWYHVGDPSAGNAYFELLEDEGLERGKKLLLEDEERGFRTARRSREQGGLDENPFGGNQNACTFVYQGNARIEERAFGPPVLRTLKREDASGPITDLTKLPLRAANKAADLQHYDRFDFPGVRPGDSFLLYDATDDDDEQVAGVGKEAGELFPAKIFTVDTIFSESADVDFSALVAVKFRDPFDFFRLKQNWLGEEEPIAITAADVGSVPDDATYAAGPKEGRTITGSFNVKYRVGFLPAAFLIRLSSDDKYNRKVLPMERVIRLVQQ